MRIAITIAVKQLQLRIANTIAVKQTAVKQTAVKQTAVKQTVVTTAYIYIQPTSFGIFHL